MTAAPSSAGAATPPALAAFLRGTERRAAVVAELQLGDADHGLRALAAAMRAFRTHAAALPMAEWPLRFWKLLAAVPTLRTPAGAAASWPPGLSHLQRLDPADRLALLLRIVAGLDEATAARVLDQTQTQYQQALARACPRAADGQPDAGGWRALADAAQQHLRELPPARLQALAALGEAALGGGAPPRPVTPPAADPPPPRRGWVTRPRLALAVALVVASLLVASLWWGAPRQAPSDDANLALGDTGPVQVEALPAESGPAPPPPLPAAPPAPLPEAAIYDLDFYAWYAAGAPAARIEREAPGAEDAAPAAGDAAAATAAVSTATVSAASAAPPPALTPAQLHEREAAWNALDAAVQARLRQVATAFGALPGEQQHKLRDEFAALDQLERHGWLLGPELGAEYWALQPLVGYVPEPQRAGLLALLRALPADQREQLALLSQRTPPQERAALRSELLAQSAETRAAWLRQRATR
ncbi:hypothetical protein [Xanthomonas sp.]|uniref:hypothetical protein n=1 Tax=Xanthomonas sp. TaxID=29446 RepID=UPI001F12B00D|nr:hypothetical protein [Xanthomonas sp.]